MFVEGYVSMYMYVCICMPTLDCLNCRQVCTFEVVLVYLYNNCLCFMFTYIHYVHVSVCLLLYAYSMFLCMFTCINMYKHVVKV